MTSERTRFYRSNRFRLTAWYALILFIIITILTNLVGDRVLVRVVTVMLISVILTVALQIFMGNSGLSSFGHIGFMAIGAYSSLWFTLTPEEKSLTLPDMPQNSAILHEVHCHGQFQVALTASSATLSHRINDHSPAAPCD